MAIGLEQIDRQRRPLGLVEQLFTVLITEYMVNIKSHNDGPLQYWNWSFD